MRHIPEAGAVCGNSARTDLCGGRGVTSVPTATLSMMHGLPEESVKVLQDIQTMIDNLS